MSEHGSSAQRADAPSGGDPHAPNSSGGVHGQGVARYDRLVRHWWNRSWGRMNRRDVYIRTDDRTFELELRLGGPEGRCWRRPYATLDEAEVEAAKHMAADQQWVDITAAHARGSYR